MKPLPPNLAFVAQIHWLQFALMEMMDGVCETLSLHEHPRIAWYRHFVRPVPSKDEVRWGSSFMCAAMESCEGFLGTRDANVRSWLRWGVLLQTPRFACVAVYDRPTRGGFWIGERDSRDYVIGACPPIRDEASGQQRLSRVAIYGVEQSDLLGYRWPIEEKS